MTCVFIVTGRASVGVVRPVHVVSTSRGHARGRRRFLLVFSMRASRAWTGCMCSLGMLWRGPRCRRFRRWQVPFYTRAVRRLVRLVCI